jgi:two-component system, OmpR family, sensor kinase
MAPLRRVLGGARTRILAAFVVLMTFSTVVSVIAIYELLIVRVDDRLEASLRQEVDRPRH